MACLIKNYERMVYMLVIRIIVLAFLLLPISNCFQPNSTQKSELTTHQPKQANKTEIRDLIIKLPKKEICWGERFEIEIQAQNPYNSNIMYGFIMASFSSYIYIDNKDQNDGIFYEGDKLKKDSNPYTNVMVLNEYKKWKPFEKKTMKFIAFPLKTGQMHISFRAAFYKNKNDFIKVPEYSNFSDQTGYAVKTESIVVKESKPFLNTMKLFIEKYKPTKNAVDYVTMLMTTPHDKSMLAYFDMPEIKKSTDYIALISEFINKNKEFVTNQNVYIKKLINTPGSDDVLRFFKLGKFDKFKKSPPKQTKAQKSNTINLSKFKGILTFDDGPHPKTTPIILKELSKHKIKKAIFFFLGYRIMEYPELVRKTFDAGFDIGYHSMYHQNQVYMDSKKIYRDIINFQKALDKALRGMYPLKYARPPFGGMTGKTVKAFHKLERNGTLARKNLTRAFTRNIVANKIIKAYKKYDLDILLWNVDFDDWVQPLDIAHVQQNFTPDLKQVWLFHEMPVNLREFEIYDNNLQETFHQFLKQISFKLN